MLSTFLLFTVIFWVANVCYTRFVNMLIQPGQLFGGWQKVLRKMAYSKDEGIRELAKPLGDCEVCFTAWLTMFSYLFYYLFSRWVIGYWITDNVPSPAVSIIVNIGWFVVFNVVGAGLSFLVSLMVNKRAK